MNVTPRSFHAEVMRFKTDETNESHAMVGWA